MKPLVISFSGGRTSAYMTKLLQEKYRNKREIITIFANTGKEREETLEFVNQCDKSFGFKTNWIESYQHHGQRKSPGFRIVDFESASRNGEPFEDMIKKHGIPNVSFPHCSRELKKRPIENFLKKIGVNEYDMALGIRLDEPKRLTPKPKIIYPLHREFPTTKLMVNQWWSKQPFDLRLKDYEGNCDLCWKKSKRKILTLLLESPSRMDWWNTMELKYGDYIPNGQSSHRQLPITFFRDNESVIELLEESKLPFKKQEDAFTLEQLMFTQMEFDFEEFGCGANSCEPF